MKFRPCIDLHSGQVKQIVGSTLTDDATGSDDATNVTTSTSTTTTTITKDDEHDSDDKETKLATNFETDRPASSYAELYRRDGLTGGHVIMLGPGNDDAAKSALAARSHQRDRR